ADTALTAGETTTVTFRFSASVTGFDASNVNLSNANGTLGPLTSNANHTVWTATFTPTANVNAGANTIRVNLAGVSGYMGNVGAISANYSVDTVRPTATITLADTALTVGETTTVTFTFNEPVNGFDASDIDLSNANGTLGPLTPTANRTVWTATFTPTANVSAGANTIRVNLAGVSDVAGNAGTGAATSANYTVDTRDTTDTTAPTATITLADTALTAGETTTVSFLFSEPVTGFDASDIDLSDAHGALGPLTPDANRTVWTATYTPTANVSAGANTILVNLAGVRDDAGNVGTYTASSANYSVDTVRPTATITLADTALTAGETTTVTFRFNEPVSGFDAGDIDLSNANGTLGPLTPDANRTVWTATLTPTAYVNSLASAIYVNLAGVRDDAGNTGTGSAISAYYSVNTVRPTATITLADTALAAGETTTVTFRFSEPVTGFDASDINLSSANGTLGPLTPNANRTVWTATLTPRVNDNSWASAIYVNLAGVRNDAGNAGTYTASSAYYTVDTVHPWATITLADSALTAGEITTATFRFNESVNGFDASDINLSSANGTLGPLTPNANRTVWTATFTPRVNDNSWASAIYVNLAGVRDDAGNAGTYIASSAYYSVDTVRPWATITLADTALTAGETTTVSFRFNEPVNGFDASDIDLSDANGSLGPLTPNANRMIWTATYTPTAYVNSLASAIYVNLAGVRDDAGNAGTGSAISAYYSVDTVRPTATITLADTALTAGETTTATFRFNEPVNGFDASDIDLSNANGTLGPLTPDANRTVWTATYTPSANASAGANTIRVNLAGVTDDAGNAGTEFASSAYYSVDTVRPTATITLADTALTAGETTTVTFRFNEPVNGFDASDINLSSANGTLGPLTPNANRTVWTATLTPRVNDNSWASAIYVNLAGVRDDAGNAGTYTASSAHYSVDTVRPTATITLADTALTAGETTTVTFRFNEPVNGFDASDIDLSNANGTLGPLTPNANRMIWTATYTPSANASAGANTIRVNLAGVRDDAGNAGTGAATSANYTVDTRDTTDPMATITLADTALTAGETTTVTFRFSEPVNGFDASDINLSNANGTLGPLTPNANRTAWTATFTPTANVSAGANTIRVNLAGVSDDAGNAGTYTASSANYSVDTVRPTAIISPAVRSFNADTTTTVTFLFSEPVTGFDAGDIDLSNANGTLGPLTPNANRTLWTATLTPRVHTTSWANAIYVNLAGVRDDAGNAGTSIASSAYYSMDTVRPTVIITLADRALTAGETTTVTFRFSEPVTGFDASDIDLSDAHGALGPLTPNANHADWTATYTPTANVSAGVNTIRVSLAGVTDNAGNAGTYTASSANYSVDTVRPTATITLTNTALIVGETTTITFLFSEPVTGFDASDINLSNANGTLGPLTPNANRTVWTATYTPTANVSAGANTIRVNLAGVTDDAGNAGTGSAYCSVDNTVRSTATITLADTALIVGETTTVTFRFNEPVTGFDASNINLSNANGTLGPLTPNANRTVWTATFTPTANVSALTNTIRVNLAGVRDDAGNAGTYTASSAHYSVDTVRPTVTMTLDNSALTAGNAATATFAFSESVNGFDASDIDLSNANGTLGSLWVTPNRAIWIAYFMVTPTTNVIDMTNTIRVNLAGVSDDAGNVGTGSVTSANYTVDTRDTTGPWVTTTLADPALTAGETTTVTFRFNEPTTGFDASDIDLSDANGTLGPLTPNANRMIWTATLTPTAKVIDMTNTIRVNLTGVRDDAGNAGPYIVPSENYAIDTRDTPGPTTIITLSNGCFTTHAPDARSTVTFTFSKPVNGFDISDIAYTSGTLSPPTANADRTVWTATLTSTANTSARTNTIRVNLAEVTDDAGTAGTGNAISDNYYVDTARPTATITLADTALTPGETTTVTFRFSEPVYDFDASDIVCSNGTLSPPTLMENTGRTVWTTTFTPTANVYAPTNAIRVNLIGVTDDSSNFGTETATSANYSVDTRPANTTGPTATITLADTSLAMGESTTVTFGFSEAVIGFTRDDIVLTDANGALGDPTTHDNGRTWTAAFTPTGMVENDSNTIGVNLAGVTNAAGRAGTGRANSANYQIDTRAPVVVRASVINEWLELEFNYTEGTNLEVPATAFAVCVDNVLTAVTAVQVDSWFGNCAVLLALATPVANGQQVTIAYTAPTTGNDANTIQDAAGNDAASFSAIAVWNHACAPQSQARSAPLTPSAPAGPTNKNTQDDMNNDSIPNNAKDQPPGTPNPAGAAPATDDDSTPDNTQTAVRSTSVMLSSPPSASQPADTASSTPVTLVAGSQDPDSSGARITRLEQEDAPAELPQGMEMPLGLLSFEATLATGRSSEAFSLYVDPALGVNGYWARDSAGHWVNLSSAPYGGKVAHEGGRLRLDFEIADGGPFDADGQANGVITAPGAVARMPLSLMGQTPDAAGGLWF
ncbi:hypothetical protein D8B22_18760, partial [Verminephrobacter aporrectodeae subsp. tuberculatae]|uniref:Ig-like domain-containing protein n=3 Tax=Verminephrobacter aporrectodeae TaxID=1110389 RepID=UPI00224358A1